MGVADYPGQLSLMGLRHSVTHSQSPPPGPDIEFPSMPHWPGKPCDLPNLSVGGKGVEFLQGSEWDEDQEQMEGPGNCHSETRFHSEQEVPSGGPAPHNDPTFR